ncbi:SURF1 family protein [Paracoccus aurantiacus]|uniref:SURF1-like protein n=1 Tax=Paracoccus aurantiacus TaxID=2599412 RepID=A0A5C6S052_9RHOB|nr:SURF1 family protein [Paracoccus aurantiacus]TXB68216.1 SURF1 family protein [Paracoccus aurantiacus]
MSNGTTERRRPLWQVAAVLFIGALLVAGFAGLGVWQMQRLGWKRDLIARVDARISAPPAPIAAVADLPPDEAEYRHVTATGRFDHSKEVLVQAVTELGGGFWVLTPLETSAGPTLFINRGFVLPERRDPATRREALPAGDVTITGLARVTEPGGAFLRSNDPGADRWYSRDLAAMAQARGTGPVAPIFIDADATPNPGGWPVGGLTVVRFRNSHLSYALTWFALAIMVAGGMAILIRHEYRLRNADKRLG